MFSDNDSEKKEISVFLMKYLRISEKSCIFAAELAYFRCAVSAIVH